MKKIIFIFLILHLSFNVEDCICQWIWQYPIPQGNKLNSVKFININTGWAVGDKGTVIKTTDGGYNWTVLYNNIDFPIADFHFVDALIGYACFNSNTIIKTMNGGQNWNIIFSGNYPLFTKIYFTDYNTGYVSGLDSGSGGGKILKTTNAGNNWIIYFSASLNDDGVYDFQILNQNITFAAHNGVQLSKTLNSGINWQTMILGWGIMKIFFADSLNGCSCGGYMNGFTPTGNVKKITNGGSNYYNVFSCVDTIFTSMHFPNSQTGYIAGYKGGIRKTTDLGTTWTTLNSGTGFNLNSITFKNINTGITVGDYGCMFMTNNGGNNWTNILKGRINNLISCRFFNENTGYIGGERTILKTINGGINWISVLDTNTEIISMKFFNPNTGFALGATTGSYSDPSYLIKTTNGGANWNFSILTNSPYPNQDAYDISMLDENTGFACGTRVFYYPPNYYPQCLFLKTTDGGQNWSSKIFAGGKCLKIHFFDNNNGIIFNENHKVYKTTNSGENWMDYTFCPNGKQFTSCLFVNQNTGWTSYYSTPNSSFFYKTTNAGNNWQLKDSINNASIKSVFFDSNNNGWAVGSAVYASSNGGNNWILQRTPVNSQLNAVFFYNSNTGWIMGNAGSILKTTSGIQSGISNNVGLTPKDFYLFQNYPNPFNSSTTIKYRLANNGFITIKVFDLIGKEIVTLINKKQSPGNYNIVFNGNELSSGIYFYQLRVGEYVETKKMVLLR